MTDMTQLSLTTTTDGDVVTLWRTDEGWPSAYGERERHNFDGHRRRYVFSVDGKSATGWGAVGGSVGWVAPSSSSYQGRETDPWENGAVPVLAIWADADTFGDETVYPSIVVRGAAYRHGLYWAPAHPSSGQAWRVDGGSLTRTNGEVTDAGRRRMWHILEAARDLFLSLPNLETELTRNSLRGAIERQNKIAREAAQKAVRMTDRLNALPLS